MNSYKILKSMMKIKHNMFDALFSHDDKLSKLRSKFPCRWCGGDMHRTYKEGLECCKENIDIPDKAFSYVEYGYDSKEGGFYKKEIK